MPPIPTALRVTPMLIALGASGGFAAKWIGLPLPFMLGSMLTVALLATFKGNWIPEGFKFPENFRAGFIALIGLMIGAQVTPELFKQIPTMAVSLAMITLFVGLAQAVNYVIFRKIGRYDPATAFFCGSPGGLIEAITLGEEAGADIRALILQQFLRIIMVVSLLPVGLSLYHGTPVGSSGGATMARGATDLAHLVPLIAIAIAGVFLGRRLHLPAGQLTGPLVLGALLSLSGIYAVDLPQWLVNLAQIIVGTSLGTRFAGIGHRMLAKGLVLALLSSGAMMAMGAAMAAAIVPLTGENFEVLLISFAPGGVTEMALVALSLSANPAYVTLHHLYRITLTVVMLGTAAKRMFPKSGP
ncbi:aminopeptidase [Litorivita pollutaquae]|uniref:Aminopeptidase n=1 Tax=Litorivita pollutaquae TaxID=2200892 RepID=A0A2V4MVR6_9RHOB|nr:AbrB family transcriptional regulator [Litorivita pollutaquae]OUS21932.1 aminopeptidase [Rhodobacterales bacterium 59_46_T64]PYC48398.1 aminopeptidase [Litorivita pollutaquae]